MVEKGVWLILGRILTAFLGMLAGVIFSRELGPVGIGQYQVFLSAQTIIITFATFGVGNAAVFFLNRGHISERGVIATFVRVFTLVAIFISIILGGFVSLGVNYFGKIDFVGLFSFCLGTGCLILFSVLYPILFFQKRIREATVVSVVSPLFFFLVILVLYWQKILSVSLILVAWGGANVVSLGSLLYAQRISISRTVQLQKSVLISIVFYGIKLSVSNLIFIIIQNSPVFFLKLYSGNEFSDVGFYSRASAISSMIFMLPTAVGPMLFSRWAYLVDKKTFREEIHASSRILFSLSFCLVVFCGIFSDEIIRLLYGKEFLPIQKALIILLISVLIQVLVEVYNNYLAAQGKALVTSYALLSSLGIIILGNILFIPTWGINGSALASLFGALFSFAFLFLYVKKNIGVNFSQSILVKKSDIVFLRK